MANLVMIGRVTGSRQDVRNLHVKGAKDEAEFITERGDWWLTIDHQYSFCVGAEEPTGFKPGDRITLTIAHDTTEAKVNA